MGARTTVTNGEGLYRFPALAPGEYTLVFTLDRFKGVRREGIYVGLGFTATVNVELQIATLQHNSLRQAEFPAKSREARVTAYAVERRLDAEKDQPRASFFAGPLQPL
jgi:hypothetical protein